LLYRHKLHLKVAGKPVEEKEFTPAAMALEALEAVAVYFYQKNNPKDHAKG
jgi:hypothetical protein